MKPKIANIKHIIVLAGLTFFSGENGGERILNKYSGVAFAIVIFSSCLSINVFKEDLISKRDV